MPTKTRLLIMVCIGLFPLIACQKQRDNMADGHHNTQTSEAKHSQNKANRNTMKIKKPNRVSRTYEQTIFGTIQDIMPLYCPVRELDWCENWQPEVVYSYSGLVEKDCIFTTKHGEEDIVWIVTDYDVEAGRVEMFYHVPGVLVTKLEIQVTPITEKRTKAVLTYSKTSLSDVGDQALEEFTKESYDTMMDSWEKAMNHYIQTGEMLTGLPHF